MDNAAKKVILCIDSIRTNFSRLLLILLHALKIYTSIYRSIIADVEDNNYLTGTIPATFGALRKLEYLTFCKYTATHPTVCTILSIG